VHIAEARKSLSTAPGHALTRRAMHSGSSPLSLLLEGTAPTLHKQLRREGPCSLHGISNLLNF
jgi:hypothetical protein